VEDACLPIPLYHGTSTFFLEDILRFGLGGKDPLADLKVLELMREIHPLIVAYLPDTDMYRARSGSFERMARQFSGSMNFQHGQTYLSPSRETAVRYAANKRYGSELLTWTLDFLQLLVERDVPRVRTDLHREYRRLFDIMDICPAPLLIRADHVPIKALISEDGGDPSESIGHVLRIAQECPEDIDLLLQQTNFRLVSALPRADLSVWLVSVTRWSAMAPEYVLYELGVI
jgi:hypothetical protein